MVDTNNGLEVAHNVELTKKEERMPCVDGNRSTKKVKIRDKSDEADECMEEHVDRESTHLGDSDQFARPIEPEPVDGTGLVSPMPKDSPLEHQPAPAVSFKDKLLGQVPSGANNAVSISSDLTIEKGDVEVDLEGLIPAISFSGRIKALMAHCMKYAVIVKLLGRFIRQDVLHARISSLWKPSGGFKLTELEGGCYMVKLENEVDYQNALLEGPWVMLGHYLTVHPWEQSLSPTNLEIKQVFGWVRLPGLPYHYYHKSILRAIGEVIGQVLRIDYHTEGFAKARFARLAVKLDLTKPLVSRIKLDGITQFVEYEGLLTICYACGRYGHLEEACPHRVQQPLCTGAPATLDRQQSTAALASRDCKAPEHEDQLFGEWMKAKPRKGRLPRVVRKDGENPSYSNERGGNRFIPLASLDNADNHKEGNPCAEVVQKPYHVNAREVHMKANKRDPKLKSTLAKDILSASTAPTPKPKVPDADTSSIFASSAYKKAYHPTSLGPAHTSVVLSPPSGARERINGKTGPYSHRPKVSERAGRIEKIAFPPKPPDRPKQHKALHLNLRTKFKASKLKTIDTLGLPSEELSKALSDALGHSIESDDEMTFSEATELGFEDDTASEKSDLWPGT